MSLMEDRGGSTEVNQDAEEAELTSKALEDHGKRNGKLPVGAEKVCEEDEKSSQPSVKAPKIGYFCEPNQNLTLDSWKIFFFHMFPFTTIPHVITLVLLFWTYQRRGLLAFALFNSIIILLALSPRIYSKRYRAAVREPFYRVLARYVPKAQYIVPEKPFPEDRAYIFACHPHGRMFYSTVIFSQLHETWRQTVLKAGDLFMTAAGGFFYIPILNILFSLVGTIPAGKRDIEAKLRQKDHVTILVGGVKEVLLGTEENDDRLYLKKRKGFCKIAMEENAGVVPVYFFNENQMFRHNSRAFMKFWERVNRYYRVGVPFMRGRFFVLPMPYRKPLLIAVGEPLFFKDGESVDNFHQRYIQAVRELFDKYVGFSPDPNHKLVIH